MNDFIVHKLSFGAICLTGDSNLPWRAEQMGDIDVDGLTNVFKTFDLGPGSLAIDVGAFIGDTALALARCGCEVIAIEPFFDAFVCLVFNTRDHPVTCINKPAGNGNYVDLNPLKFGDNFGMRWTTPSDKQGSTLTLRIDDMRLPRCDFIKVDCEGFEYEALKGAEKTIATFKPKLFVEVYKEALERNNMTIEGLGEYIKGLGYSLEMVGAEPRWDWYCKPL